MDLGLKLKCPTCSENCHTLHQNHSETEKGKSEQPNLSNEEKGPSSNVQEFNCLYCDNPCHVVVSLLTKEQSSTLTTVVPKEKMTAKESQTPSEADAKEESNFTEDGVNDNTKLICLNCDHYCHSLDSNKPALLKEDDEKMEVKHYFFVQNLECCSCHNFCHKIYTQPTVIKTPEDGKVNEDPDQYDPLL